MAITLKKKQSYIQKYLESFVYNPEYSLFEELGGKTIVGNIEIEGEGYPLFINEYWTSKQRQVNTLHEIAYRACFKAQLPNFFISLLTEPGDVVYDPFSGRGTTIIEAAILNRNIIANDINPISKILSYPRLIIPNMTKLNQRLESILFDDKMKADIDLSMFYHQKTEAEIVFLKQYLKERRTNTKEDELDNWIRMVATNRLTGHSAGFFSVYTLPPNQAVSQESQIKINEKRKQKPEYRNVRKLILKKSQNLISEISKTQKEALKQAAKNSLFLSEDARKTKQIKNEIVKLTVTSPPFLDVVNYADDNWLRCWFNSIDPHKINGKLTTPKKIEDWCNVMEDVFKELFRITKYGGHVAFEVGEVRNGKLNLEEYVVPLGIKAGFACESIMINQQKFTKTANIWGVSNNIKGTNTNRIVIFIK
ncbi:MAG: DNA adenine methylase [Armatimonadetes bacterium]|nr:DNA adenine methylase [Armatimonadota bacterium]